MDNKEVKINKVMIKVIIALVASVLSVALSITATLAWASKNMKVKENAFSLSISPDLLDAFASTNRFIILGEELSSSPKSSFLPGSSENVFIGMYNKSTSVISIDGLSLEIPEVWINGVSPETYDKNQTGYTSDPNDIKYDEMPIIFDGKYYYFGHNVKISIVEYKTYWATYEGSENEGQVVLGTNITTVSYTEQQIADRAKYILPDPIVDIERIELLNQSDFGGGSLELIQDMAVVFEFKIEFVNNEYVDQSMFMGFGTQTVGGYSHRNIYVDFKQEVQ